VEAQNNANAAILERGSAWFEFIAKKMEKMDDQFRTLKEEQ
jgi:hypothetical protein